MTTPTQHTVSMAMATTYRAIMDTAVHSMGDKVAQAQAAFSIYDIPCDGTTTMQDIAILNSVVQDRLN